MVLLRVRLARVTRGGCSSCSCRSAPLPPGCCRRPHPRTARSLVSPSAPQTRRSALASFAGAAALLSGAAPSLAAYGENANVFGKITNKSGFAPYVGEGFALLLPSKWNPSKEKDFPGVVLRCEGKGGHNRGLCLPACRQAARGCRPAPPCPDPPPPPPDSTASRTYKDVCTAKCTT